MKVMLSQYVVRNMVEGIPVIGNLKNSHVIGNHIDYRIIPSLYLMNRGDANV